MNNIRPEFELISDWIIPNSHVLDLGCGDGQLLTYLRDKSNVTGYGMEIDPDKNIKAMEAGLNVIQSNLDVNNICDYFDEGSFDYLIMTQAIQVVTRPDLLLDEMLAVGKQCIITFPNFGHWRMRLQLLLNGRMPETETLPYRWYDTPNIRMCTFKDFEALCAEKNIEVVDRTVVNSSHQHGWGMKLFPNWLGEVALYKIQRKASKNV